MLEIETKDCKAAGSGYGAMKVVIKGISLDIIGYLERAACQSVEDREHFECIVEKTPLVQAMVARLEELNQPDMGRGRMEQVYLLQLLDLHWD